jgi:hypothetical protein
MDDGVDVAQGPPARVGIPHVAVDELEVVPPPHPQERRNRPMQEGVEDADAMPALEQLVDDDRADVACSPGDECPTPHLV